MNKKALVAMWLACAVLPLAGCESDEYGGRFSVGYGPGYAYNGWYDGAYGTIYDGYWGTDGVFYYRQSARDRIFRRGDAIHFRRGDAPPPGARYHRFEGATRPAPGQVRAPNFPGQGQPRPGRPEPPRGDHRQN